MEYFIHTFPNGLRLVHKQTASPIAHAGVIVGAGTRHELPGENGLAHMVEHCLFKGTRKRSATAIIQRMEEVGGDMNAYTSKEEMFVHASFLVKYFPRALELFADLFFHSVFPAKELDIEKKVIIEEIKGVKDNPYELIFDEFDSLMFKDHPLGRNILGDVRTVKKFIPEDLAAFASRHFHPGNMIISSVSKLDPGHLVRLIERYFPVSEPDDSGTLPHAVLPPAEIPQLADYVPFEEKVYRRTYQTHCILGAPAYSYDDDRRIHFALLNNLLGGPAMSSILNLHLREKRGRVYSVESHFSPYLETGSFAIYLGTDQKMLDDSLRLVRKILFGLLDKPLHLATLEKAKRQFLGQMAISFDSNYGQMISMAKNVLVYNRVDTYEEIRDKILAVDAGSMQEVAREILDPSRMSMLLYQTR